MHLLEALTEANVMYLLEHPNTPPILQAGVRYVREPVGMEEWRGIGEVIRNGEGDCEDLATWLAAAFRVKGIKAAPFFKWRRLPSGMLMYHIMVRLPGGRVLDPSRQLGMGKQAFA